MMNEKQRPAWSPGFDISNQQTPYALAKRVPFLTSAHPSRSYVSGIIVGAYFHHGLVPTEEEVLAVADFIKVRLDEWFPKPNSYRDDMERYAPFDIDMGPAVYFMKYAHHGWCYREGTWIGPEFRPPVWQTPPATIQEVLEEVKNR